jgi:hypothetical protein
VQGLLGLVLGVALGLTPVAGQNNVRSIAGHHQHLYRPVIAPASQIAPITARDLVALLDAAGIRRGVVLSQALQAALRELGRRRRELARSRSRRQRASA